MSFSKYQTLDTYNNVEMVETEIIRLQKELFELRIKKITTQKIQSHLFRKLKSRIAQLKFKKSSFYGT